MIKVNNVVINQEKFGDGTLKLNCIDYGNYDYNINILWLYESDSEIFTLNCIVDYLRYAYSDLKYNLFMPYIPNARQDRMVSNRVFTLKTFSKMINSLNFNSVYVLDPHSDVSVALINNCYMMPDPFVTLLEEDFLSDEHLVIMYPDNGAAKKYNYKTKSESIIGYKHRDENGRIDGYFLHNFKDGTKHVIIRDDICSYGGTFCSAAKALRERGVEKIVLFVTHCENNCVKGDLFNYVDHVYTTDDLLDYDIIKKEYPQFANKITIIKSYREGVYAY